METEMVPCPYCQQNGALVVPLIAPASLAAPQFDHLPDCPKQGKGRLCPKNMK